MGIDVSRFDEDSRRAAKASHSLYVESVEAPLTLTLEVERDQDQLVLEDATTPPERSADGENG